MGSGYACGGVDGVCVCVCVCVCVRVHGTHLTTLHGQGHSAQVPTAISRHGGEISIFALHRRRVHNPTVTPRPKHMTKYALAEETGVREGDGGREWRVRVTDALHIFTQVHVSQYQDPPVPSAPSGVQGT